MKDYIEWGVVKAQINNIHCRPVNFRARQIWWCHIGENIGYEEDGKQAERLRPVLILKRFNNQPFFGIPLKSVQKKNSIHYYEVWSGKRGGWAIFSQVRTWDALRLVNKIGEIDRVEFNRLKGLLGKYLGF